MLDASPTATIAPCVDILPFYGNALASTDAPPEHISRSNAHDLKHLLCKGSMTEE